MKAGFSKVVITPPIGTTMMGFGNRDMAHGCDSVRDDVYTRAVFLEHSGEKALIMSFDLCFIGREESIRFKEAIGGKIGLSPKQILLNTSHTHVSASAGKWYSAAYNLPDYKYLNQLEQAIIEAASKAKDTALEVTVWSGTAHTKIPMSRRRKLEDGSIAWWQPSPEGVVYDKLPVCLFKNTSGEPVCLLFSVSSHPAIMTGFEISAEYPGVAMKILDDYLGNECSLFLQGVAGDSEPTAMYDGNTGMWQERNNFEIMNNAGKLLGKEVIETLEKKLAEIEPQIRTAMTEMTWPLSDIPSRNEFKNIIMNIPESERNKNNIKYMWAKKQLETLDKGQKLCNSVNLILQGIQIGKDLRIIALEGEPVSEWGYIIENFYCNGVTFPIGYSNGTGLYLPVTKMLFEGGYEVESYWEYGYPAPIAANMEAVVLNALSKIRSAGIN